MQRREEYTALAAWWLHEIREALADIQHWLAPGKPHRTTISLSPTAGRVVQEWRGGTVRSAEFQRTPSGDLPVDRAEFWPTTARDNVTVHVVLPASTALIRRIWLPVGAERNLASVISLELERELPLPREQVRIDWRIGARNRDRTRIEVIIAILRREELERLIEALHRWKLRIASIGVAIDGATAFNFSPRRARHSAVRLARGDRILAIGTGLMLLAYFSVIGAQWMYERRTVEKVLDQTSEPARRVEHMQSRLAKLRVPLTTLTQLMQATSSTEVLTDLTSAIPHESWVQQLELRAIDADSYVVKLVAITPAATLLVDHLARTPHMQSVELQAASLAQPLGPDRAEIQTTWRKPPLATGTASGRP